MRAATYQGPERPLVVKEVPTPKPTPGEILVRVAACGACHSDLHAMQEHFAPLDAGHIPGHEISGQVERIGTGCANRYHLAVGDPVLVSWIASCGRCDECARGAENLCRFLEMPGLTPGRPGGLAEFVAVPEHVVVPLPAAVDLADASVLACAYATSYNALRNRAKLQAGESLAVFGCGGVGLAAIQLGAAFDAHAIYGVDIVGTKLQWAEALGATRTFHAGEQDVVADVLEATEQRGVDLAVEAMPAPRLESSLEVVRRDGRVVVIGLHPLGTRVPLDMMGFSLYNLTLIACLGYSPSRDLPPLIDLVASGQVDPGRLVTRTFPLEEVNDAYDALRRGRVARAVVRLEDG